MRIFIVLLLLMGNTFFYAQIINDTIVITNTELLSNPEGNTSGKGSRFTTSSKQYNDWSIAFYGGTNGVQGADFATFQQTGHDRKGIDKYGYTFQFAVTKEIGHAFGLQLIGEYGYTKQGASVGTNVMRARTIYSSAAIMGVLNLSNLLRRLDNHSELNWGLRAYGGIGLMGYNAEVKGSEGVYKNGIPVASPGQYVSLIGSPDVAFQPLDINSFFIQGGLEFLYKISRRIDIGAKMMYVFTGDETFDGSGNPVYDGTNLNNGGQAQVYSYADLEEGRDDGLFTFTLGLHFKFGKHPSSLFWTDPLQELLNKQPPPPPPATGCIEGDNDEDGVCDDWDKCLDTPRGARVYGDGCPIDTDGDGYIDLLDKCPLVPCKQGVDCDPNNIGCPLIVEVIKDDLDRLKYDGIVFKLNSAKIENIGDNYKYLENAANILKEIGPGKKVIVQGHTDDYGTPEYNLNLSQKRTDAVVKWLEQHGVPAGQLEAEGVGANDLKFPECRPASKCPDWKNQANRRVIFELAK